MTKKTMYLLGILLTIVVGTILYYLNCCNCKVGSVEGKVPDLSANLPKNGFKLNADGLDYQSTNNFDFKANGFNTISPLNDSIDIGLNALKAYLVKNPNSNVLITGYALAKEKNTSAYTNLGEARAVEIKNYIVNKGFSSSQFDTKGEIIDQWSLKGDTVLGPVKFMITKTSEVKQIDWNVLKQKINSNPLTLYFETGQTEINLTPEERQKVSDLANYLGHVESSSINVVGYTDNTGDVATNLKLGLERASFASEYLIKNGISANKIKTLSKGIENPIADNATKEGRAKNRRTVINLN